MPSNMSIAGNDVLISYAGQPQTCYRCNETGHQRQDCPRGKRLGPPSNMQPTHPWADVVSSKPQEQDTLMLMPQKPPTREAKTKRHNTPPEEAPDSKRVPTNRNTEDGSDAKDMDIHDAVGGQKDNDMIETEDVQMTDTEEQESVDRTQNLGREKVKVTRTGIGKTSHDYDVSTGDGETPSGTQNEELETEETHLEGMYTTEAMPAMQMNTVRAKKLKTDRDEPATKIRNRSKTRTMNVNNKGTQP